jgi:hypothetical protein
MGAERPPKRAYHRHGLHTVSRALPGVMERVTDADLPADELTSVERAARAWRDSVLADLGGADQIPAARRAIVDAATGTLVLLHSVDRYLFQLAARDGLVNRRSRRAFQILSDRQRLADGLTKQCQAIGLDRVKRPPLDLSTYIEQRYGNGTSTAATAASTTTPRVGATEAPVAVDRAPQGNVDAHANFPTNQQED